MWIMQVLEQIDGLGCWLDDIDDVIWLDDGESLDEPCGSMVGLIDELAL